jgi:putative sigma-54 modulation protein
MKIDVIARHFDVSEKTKDYASNEVKRLTKLFDRITKCKVIMEREKNDYHVEINLDVPGDFLVAKETSDELMKSIDNVVKKMLKQLDRYRGKHNKKNHASNKEFIIENEEY